MVSPEIQYKIAYATERTVLFIMCFKGDLGVRNLFFTGNLWFLSDNSTVFHRTWRVSMQRQA